MFEVHAQKRPGRPVLRIAISAALLVAAMTAAWVQARGRFALGPSVQIEGTPLRLRLPAGWVQLDDAPPEFGQPVRGRRGVARRRLIVRYTRRDTFFDPGRRASSGTFRRARIGRLAAVEFRGSRVVRIGHRVLMEETVVRLACSPRGDWIHLEYFPARDYSPSERRLFEAICASIEIEGVEPIDAEQVAAMAGVHFELPGGAQIFAGDGQGGRGVYVASEPQADRPWVIGVFRTFLVPFRGSDDLLRDLAVDEWDADPQRVQVVGSQMSTRAAQPEAGQTPIFVRRREDGTFVLRIENPELEGAQGELASASVIEKDPTRVAMLLVFAGPQAAAAAEPFVQRIGESLRFEDAWPEVDAALEHGRSLAQLLTRQGLLPWWGLRPPQAAYGAATLEGPAVLIDRRWPRDGDPKDGYAGCLALYWRRNTGAAEFDAFVRQAWQIGPMARTYRLEVEIGAFAGRQRRTITRIEQRRDRPDGPVYGSLSERDGTTRSVRFTPTASFVAPPAESVAEQLVASAVAGPSIIEVAHTAGGRTHWAYLRPAAQTDAGAVLVRIDDFWPTGQRAVLDASGLPDQLRLRFGRLERLDDPPGSGFAPLLRAARQLCQNH